MDLASNFFQPDIKEVSLQPGGSSHSSYAGIKDIISLKIRKVLSKKVIVGSFPDSHSCIFTRDKKDGNKGIILNLNRPNKSINYKDSKIGNVIKLLKH